MKAKEYYEKYRPLFYEAENGVKGRLVNGKEVKMPPTEEDLNKLGFGLFEEFMKESGEMAKRRKIFKPIGLKSLIDEFNDKWNALCNLFEKDYGESPIRRNGFRLTLLQMEPKFRVLYEERQTAPRLFEMNI